MILGGKAVGLGCLVRFSFHARTAYPYHNDHRKPSLVGVCDSVNMQTSYRTLGEVFIYEDTNDEKQENCLSKEILIKKERGTLMDSPISVPFRDVTCIVYSKKIKNQVFFTPLPFYNYV